MRSIAQVLLAAVILAGLIGCAENGKMGAGSGGPAKLAIRVDCGDPNAYVDENGVTWLGDQIYDGPATWGALGGLTVRREGLKITGTKSPGLYLTERYSMDGYFFKVPNGTYMVRLYFAETYDQHTKAGMRVFSVTVNGAEALKDLDVFQAAGGFAKPLVKEIKDVKVTGGSLEIGFVPKTQNAEINAIEILQQ